MRVYALKIEITEMEGETLEKRKTWSLFSNGFQSCLAKPEGSPGAITYGG